MYIFVCESNCFKFILSEFRLGSQSYIKETKLFSKFSKFGNKGKNALITFVEDVIGDIVMGLFQQNAALI